MEYKSEVNKHVEESVLKEADEQVNIDITFWHIVVIILALTRPKKIRSLS